MMREISWLLRITAVVCIMGVAAGKASQPSSPALVAKNYPKEVHQMFQERLNGRGKTPSLGSWASWSQWSSCSRSCGGGVATQTRECRRRGRGSRRRRSRTDAADNSTLGPGDMKSQCVGVYKRFHICNDQACPVGTKDFRQLQCESFNGKQFMGRVYLWEPFLDAPSRCELNCRAVGFRFYATLNQTVVDGTPCRGDFPGRWVCVSDMCKHVGCDGVVGSNKKMDSCGVCGGNNNTCRLVSGLFTMPQLPEGYNLIAQVPRGACNISISEMKPSRNYLALRKADGQYALNGNWAINWSGDYEAAGAVFSFKRQDTVAGEVITASGPLQEPIDIMVLYQQPNPGIKYEYMLPMSSDAALLGAMVPPVAPSVTRPGALNSVIAPPLLLPGGVGKIPVETPVVKDGTVQDSPDSRSPTFPYGSGVLGTDSRPAVITYHQTAGEARPVIGTHSNHQGPAEEPHKPIGKSKSRKRKFAWKLAGFTECTKTCGGGLSTTMVVCVREHSQITVPERRCGYQEKPHPQTIRCNNKPCPAEWVPGEWGECSVTCGDGVQTRDMMCKQEITPTLTMKVAEGACLKPPSQSRTQACQRPECPTQGPPQEWTRRTRWETGQWGQCSVPCGQGKRSRMVKCVGVNNSEQEDCLQNDQPAQEEECNLSPCPNTTAQYPWMYTEWTQQCSEECGTGVQTRRVHCSVDLHCDLGLRPDDTRACSSDKQCSGKWFAGPWGQCSPGCGQGHQTRDVVCVAFIRGQHHVALYMNCPENLKPDTDRVCESNPCAPDWFITEWGQCSRECGTGVQKREVKCLDDKQQLSSGCAEDARPPSRRVCNTHDCSTGSATEKSSSHPLSRIDDDPSLSNGAGDQALPDETLHKGGECVDIYPNCNLVVQARLCKYKYYRTYCCHSCHKF